MKRLCFQPVDISGILERTPVSPRLALKLESLAVPHRSIVIIPAQCIVCSRNSLHIGAYQPEPVSEVVTFSTTPSASLSFTTIEALVTLLAFVGGGASLSLAQSGDMYFSRTTSSGRGILWEHEFRA